MLRILRGVMSATFTDPEKDEVIAISLQYFRIHFLQNYPKDIHWCEMNKQIERKEPSKNIEFSAEMQSDRKQKTASIFFRLLYRHPTLKYYRWINEVEQNALQNALKQQDVLQFLDIMSILKGTWSPGDGGPRTLYSVRNYISAADLLTMTTVGTICTMTSTMSCTIKQEVMENFHYDKAECSANFFLTIPKNTSPSLFIDMLDPTKDEFPADALTMEEEEIVLRPGIVFEITNFAEERAVSDKNNRIVNICAIIIDGTSSSQVITPVHMGACNLCPS
jgi:hypothetical protein